MVGHDGGLAPKLGLGEKTNGLDSEPEALLVTNPDWISNNWGVNRLTKEIYDRGFKLVRPTNAEGGLLYRNMETGDQIRIMKQPSNRWRNDPSAKFENDYYFRYKPNNGAWGPHTTIPNK